MKYEGKPREVEHDSYASMKSERQCNNTKRSKQVLGSGDH